MNTLLLYATKYGCTEKCAKKLSQRLTGHVDVKNIKELKQSNLQMYDKIIIGGSIYMGKIQLKIKKFCKDNISLLEKKKIALFLCCMFTGEKAEENLKKAFPEELYTNAIVKDYFGGEMNFKQMSFLDKQITKMVATASKSDENLPKIDLDNGSSFLSFERIAKFADVVNSYK